MKISTLPPPSLLTLLLSLAIFCSLFPLAHGSSDGSIQPIKLEHRGELLDAAAGSNFIGVLFSRDGSIYYSEYDPAGEWAEAIALGYGTGGRLVMDGEGRPHVVFTTEDGEIAYTTREGSDWDSIKLIESRHGGVCYWPHLDVDSNNQPHITYTDSMGDTAGTTMQPDIMYAHLEDEAFAVELLYSGRYSASARAGTYYEKGSFIALDENDNRYILTQRRSYDHWMQVFHSRSIFVAGSNTETLGSISSNQNRFDIFGLKVVEGSVFALYRNGSELFVSEMTINDSGGITARTNSVVFEGSHAHSFEVVGDDIVVGGKSGDNLRVQHNDSSEIFPEIEVMGSAVSVAHLDDVFYVFYADPNQSVIVTFEPEGGSDPDPAEIEVDFDSTYGELATTTREGHTFDGWWTEPGGGGTLVTETTVVSIDEDHSLYASWTLNEYTLDYAAGEGGIIEGPASQTVGHGNDGAVVTAVPATGWFFAQWGDGVTTAERQELSVIESHEVTAEFARIEYTLDYAAGVGGNIEGPASQTVSHGNDGAVVTAVPEPGWFFAQWSDGVASAERQELTVTESLEVTAEFARLEILQQPENQTVTKPSPATFIVIAEGVPSLRYRWERSTDGGSSWTILEGSTENSYETGATELAMSGYRYRVVISNDFGEVVSATAILTVEPPEPGFEDVPGFGEVEVLPQDNRYRSETYGELAFADEGANRSRAFSHSLGAWLDTDGQSVWGADYGNLSPASPGWVNSGYFGLVHFGEDGDQYAGWVWSQRFGWMRFVQSGDQNFLWAHDLQTWMVVHGDGSFTSFDFGRLTPLGGFDRYHSNLIGNFTTGDFGGWVASDRFGFTWAARNTNAVWFYSGARQDWLGVLAPGVIWSTNEQRFLE